MKLLNEEQKRMQKLAGIISENTSSNKEEWALISHDIPPKALHTFNQEPHYTEVMDIVSKLFGKKVVDYVMLDRENVLFKFDDNTDKELLIAKKDTYF